MRYTLKKDNLEITADTYGGELVSVTLNGVERLRRTQTGDWDRHAPPLFPVCGHCEMLVEGKDYSIPAHGFASKKEFVLKEKGEDFLAFLLESDEETRKVYPFDFSFETKYEIQGNQLTISQTVKNVGEKPLYFSLGGHESFALDKPLDQYELAFEKEEELIHHYHSGNTGCLTGKTEDFGKRDRLILPVDFLVDSLTIIFPCLKSRKVSLKEVGEQGKTLANITFDGFENLLLWRDIDGEFICIEPWLNLPDTVGETKEFSEKKGVVKLGKNKTKTFIRTIEYL